MKNELNITNSINGVERREEIIDALGFAAERFLADEDCTKGIHAVLERIAEAVSAESIFLYKSGNSENNTAYFHPYFKWDYKNQANQIDIDHIEPAVIGRWLEAFDSGEPIYGRQEEFNAVESEFFGFYGVKSLLAVPVKSCGALWGFILVSSLTQERKWDDFEIKALMSIGHILGSALNKDNVEKHLTESREKSNMITEHSSDVIYRLTFRDMKYDYMSPSVVKITGYTSDEIKEIGVKAIIERIENSSFNGADYSEVYNQWNEGEIEEYSAEYLITTKHNEKKWIRDQSFPWRDKSGKVIGSIGALQDITGLRKVEGELRYHDEILKAIIYAAESFLSSPDWRSRIKDVLERMGRAVDVHRAYIVKNIYKDGEIEANEILYTWNDEEFPLPNMSEVKYIPIKESPLKRWVEKLQKGEIVTGSKKDFDEEASDFLKTIKAKSVLGTPIFVDNQLWGLIGFDDCKRERTWFQLDIEALSLASRTLAAAIQRNIYEQELIKSKENAEKSDKLKSEFLAQVSHEMRTPVNSIQSFITLIQSEIEADLPNDLKTAFKMVSNGCRRLIRTVDLILNMSELQAGTYIPMQDEINLYKDVLNQIMNEYSREAESKKLELIMEKKTENPVVKGDLYSIQQVFTNIIDNALKFTEEGEVKLSVFESGNTIGVEVKDTGIGISEEFMPKLFEPFSQEESGYTRRYDGTGLGLPLTKKFCELNNAQIDVVSVKGYGTRFIVKFPKS